jgi:hypothetical protein
VPGYTSILICRRPRDKHPEAPAFFYDAGDIALAAAHGDEEAVEVEGDIFAGRFPSARATKSLCRTAGQCSPSIFLFPLFLAKFSLGM